MPTVIILGILMIKNAKGQKQFLLYHVWRERYGITGKKNITAVLSFGFYIQVVLFSDAFPLVGILMIPKTCAYVWAVVIGFSAMRKNDTGAAA